MERNDINCEEVGLYFNIDCVLELGWIVICFYECVITPIIGLARVYLDQWLNSFRLERT